MKFLEKAKEEMIKAGSLAAYFAIWFCSLTFLAATDIQQTSLQPTLFGLAIIKAGLCAKFMLIAQAIFPIKVNKVYGLFRSLFKISLIYLLIVLILSCLESGIDSLVHKAGFIEGILEFGHHSAMRILALSIVYWLIVWPYLIFCGIDITLGKLSTKELLFGSKSKA